MYQTQVTRSNGAAVLRAHGSISAQATTPDLESHQDLLRDFLAARPKACRLVQQWAQQVIRFSGYGIAPGEHDDLVQETLTALWKTCSKPGFTLHTSLRALVRKIAMARCIDWMRGRHATAELDESLVDPNPGPQELQLHHDERSRVQWAIERLGPSVQEIVRLHFLEGVSYAEMAARLGRAEATLRVHVFHGIRQIRRLLERADMATQRAVA